MTDWSNWMTNEIAEWSDLMAEPETEFSENESIFE